MMWGSENCFGKPKGGRGGDPLEKGGVCLLEKTGRGGAWKTSGDRCPFQRGGRLGDAGWVIYQGVKKR